jgi:hypothetical protein
MHPIASTCSSLGLTLRDLHDDATRTTCSCVFTSLEARLRNPSSTCFHTKQAARSRHVSHVVLHPSVLWHNWQTEARLVLRPKPRNRYDDFDAQINKLELSVLRPKSGNRQPWFWGSTKKLALLVSLYTVQTTHGITRPPDHPVTKYLTCAWSSPVFCTRSHTHA